METPNTIWMDERVLQTIKTERDPNYDAKQVGYIRMDAAAEATRKAVDECLARIPDEYVIQIQAVSVDGGENTQVLALTNLGRIFEEVFGGEWQEYRGPKL